MREVVPGTTGVTFEFPPARLMRAFLIAFGVLLAPGFSAIRQAARPAMWGVAMDVPLIVLEPDVPGEIHALVISPPGA